MIKLILGAAVVAWVWAGARNMPRLDHPQNSAACLVIASCIIGAYWLGTRSKRADALANAAAVAIASARSESSSVAGAVSQVQVVIHNRDQGATAVGDALGFGGKHWISDVTVPEIDSDAMESVMDDVMDEREKHGAL